MNTPTIEETYTLLALLDNQLTAAHEFIEELKLALLKEKLKKAAAPKRIISRVHYLTMLKAHSASEGDTEKAARMQSELDSITAKYDLEGAHHAN